MVSAEAEGAGGLQLGAIPCNTLECGITCSEQCPGGLVPERSGNRD